MNGGAELRKLYEELHMEYKRLKGELKNMQEQKETSSSVPRASRLHGGKERLSEEPPVEYMCPITQELMVDPVRGD